MGRKSNYENRMYQQLMEIMGRLETVEKNSAQKINTLNQRIDILENENLFLKKKQLLKNYNARLRSIINNDSSNSSLPPSSDQKSGRPANTYNSRPETKRKAGGIALQRRCNVQ